MPGHSGTRPSPCTTTGQAEAVHCTHGNQEDWAAAQGSLVEHKRARASRRGTSPQPTHPPFGPSPPLPSHLHTRAHTRTCARVRTHTRAHARTCAATMPQSMLQPPRRTLKPGLRSSAEMALSTSAFAHHTCGGTTAVHRAAAAVQQLYNGSTTAVRRQRGNGGARPPSGAARRHTHAHTGSGAPRGRRTAYHPRHDTIVLPAVMHQAPPARSSSSRP